MITNILVPTDGSEHAVKAVTFAADIAAKYGARVVLLHALLVRISSSEILGLIEAGQISTETREELKQISELQNRVQVGGSMLPTAIPVSVDRLEKVGKDVLKSAQKLAEEHGAKNVHKILTNGEPIHCILRAMDDENIDLIVMGSRGLSDLAGLFVGSVSHKVSQLAECTVVTVK